MTSSMPRTDTATEPATDGAWRRLFLGRPRGRHDHLDALDGLRGLAVAIVLGSHLSNAGMPLLPGLDLSGTGKSGVYLFFVLSAFLLARILADRPPAAFASAWTWADYALRRVLRIWPLYLVVLVSAWVMTRWSLPWHYAIDTPALWRHLTLREGQSVLWSIPVEFTFYLWLPPIALGIAWLRARRPGIAWELAAGGALLAAALWAWPPSQAGVNDVRLGPYLSLFLLGAFAARLDLGLRDAGKAPSQAAWGAVGLLAVAALLATTPVGWAWLSGQPKDPALNHTWFPFFGLAWSALLLAVLHGPSWLRVPFASTPARLLGVVSFSAYLWHMPVLDALRAAGVAASPWPAGLVVAAVLAASMLSYLVFERPWRDLRLRPAPRS